MKIEVDVWSEAELRALSAFALALADARNAQYFEKMAASDATEKSDGAAADLDARIAQNRVAADAQQAVPQRERGKPAPGRARRTKEEIAEDEAADKADAANTSQTQTMAISSGENRVGPEDSGEDQAQDRTDEAAESTKQPEAPLTADDLRKVMSDYVAKFGVPETQEDGPKIFKAAIGDPPAGEQYWKISVVSAAQLPVIIDAWAKAAASPTRFGA